MQYQITNQIDLGAIVKAVTTLETVPHALERLQQSFAQEGGFNAKATRDGKFSDFGCIVRWNGKYAVAQGNEIINGQIFIRQYPDGVVSVSDQPTYRWVNIEDVQHAYREN